MDKHNLIFYLDVQVSYQEVEKDLQNNRGDFSPNRVSKVAKEEYQHRLHDSTNKDKRALTPPNRKQTVPGT